MLWFNYQDKLKEGLKGKLLVASPTMSEEPFSKSIIYICEHGDEGAMGLIINRPIENLNCKDILNQLDKDDTSQHSLEKTVHAGGPLDEQRGFILHSNDYASRHTVDINEGISVTSSIDILKHIAGGKGPDKSLVVLGYAGWRTQQLEQEIEDQSWFVAEPDKDIIFSDNHEMKWVRASGRIGIRPEFFMTIPGNC